MHVMSAIFALQLIPTHHGGPRTCRLDNDDIELLHTRPGRAHKSTLEGNAGSVAAKQSVCFNHVQTFFARASVYSEVKAAISWDCFVGFHDFSQIAF